MAKIPHTIFFLVALAILIQGTTAQAQLLGEVELEEAEVYKNLEEALENPDEVYKLRLRNKKFKEFPVEVLKFKNLNSLDISRNQLTSIPPEVSSLPYLQELIANRNLIDTLYPEIGTLPAIRKLDLGRNQIKILPPEIGKLKTLEVLSLWDNYIEDLPKTISNCKNLRVLDLRLMQFSDETQRQFQDLVPGTKVHMEASCDCY